MSAPEEFGGSINLDALTPEEEGLVSQYLDFWRRGYYEFQEHPSPEAAINCAEQLTLAFWYLTRCATAGGRFCGDRGLTANSLARHIRTLLERLKKMITPTVQAQLHDLVGPEGVQFFGRNYRCYTDVAMTVGGKLYQEVAAISTSILPTSEVPFPEIHHPSLARSWGKVSSPILEKAAAFDRLRLCLEWEARKLPRSTPKPRSPNLTNTIVYQRDGYFRIGDWYAERLTDRESLLLQQFIGGKKWTGPELKSLTQVPRPDRVLHDLETRYEGRFWPAITCPMKGSRGGYSVFIIEE